MAKAKRSAKTGRFVKSGGKKTRRSRKSSRNRSRSSKLRRFLS